MKTKISKSQKVWDYVRRNPIFRAGDISIVTDINIYIVTTYLASWQKGGYVTLIEDSKNIRNKVYRLNKKSVFAPARDKNGKAIDRKHNRARRKKVIKDLQSAQERAEIKFTHVDVKTKEKEAINTKTNKIALQARLIKGAKGIGYSPTVFKIDDVGNIVCKDTGFVVDKVEVRVNETCGYVCSA